MPRAAQTVSSTVAACGYDIGGVKAGPHPQDPTLGYLTMAVSPLPATATWDVSNNVVSRTSDTDDTDAAAACDDERHALLMSALRSLPQVGSGRYSRHSYDYLLLIEKRGFRMRCMTWRATSAWPYTQVVDVLEAPPASTLSRASRFGEGFESTARPTTAAGLWNFQFATEDATGLKELVGGTPVLHPDVGAFWKSPAAAAPNVPVAGVSAAASDASNATATAAAATEASGPAASASAGSSAVTAMGTPDAGLLYLVHDFASAPTWQGSAGWPWADRAWFQCLKRAVLVDAGLTALLFSP